MSNDESRFSPVSLVSSCWILDSVSMSTAEVVSSRIKIDGSFAKARANEIRCFWPPDKPTPAHRR